MKQKIRVAIIGLGWVGQARHIPALGRDENLDLVGIIDRRPGRAQEVASKHRLAHYAAASDLGSVPWMDQVDAISVATAPHAHHDLVCEALALGKHVITEKPFAMSVAQGRAMCDAALEAKRTLAVVHNFQFARSMKRMIADLEKGRLGAIRGLNAVQLGNPKRRLPTWYEELPLGLFYDESPHLLYLLRRIAGKLTLHKALTIDGTTGQNTPARLDAWFSGEGTNYPISLSCNFESPVSEWYLMVFGEKRLGIVDIFRDIYISIPNDEVHGTGEVLRTSVAATAQHWFQHLASGIPHMRGTLLYGNSDVFGRFGRAALGQADALGPIGADDALDTLTLQHEIIECRESVYTAPGGSHSSRPELTSLAT